MYAPPLSFRDVAHIAGFDQAEDLAVIGHRINGVRMVRDTVSSRGKPVERTLDFYAQDKQGNVWYMGEDSFELRHGRFVKSPDSWQAGINDGQRDVAHCAKVT